MSTANKRRRLNTAFEALSIKLFCFRNGKNCLSQSNSIHFEEFQDFKTFLSSIKSSKCWFLRVAILCVLANEVAFLLVISGEPWPIQTFFRIYSLKNKNYLHSNSSKESFVLHEISTENRKKDNRSRKRECLTWNRITVCFVWEMVCNHGNRKEREKERKKAHLQKRQVEQMAFTLVTLSQLKLICGAQSGKRKWQCTMRLKWCIIDCAWLAHFFPYRKCFVMWHMCVIVGFSSHSLLIFVYHISQIVFFFPLISLFRWTMCVCVCVYFNRRCFEFQNPTKKNWNYITNARIQSQPKPDQQRL